MNIKDRIMKRHCKGCVHPEGASPDEMMQDCRQFIDAGKMQPHEAAWSCFHTCTRENINSGKTKVCRGCANFFGITETDLLAATGANHEQ